MKRLDTLGWRSYYVVRPSLDDKYVIQCNNDRKRIVLLKLLAVYNQSRFNWVPEESGLQDLVAKFNETVGTHNILMFLLWLSKQSEFDDVVQSVLSMVSWSNEGPLQFTNADGLLDYLRKHPGLLDAAPTIRVPAADEYVNGDKLAAIVLRVTHDETGQLLKPLGTFTEHKIRAALRNLTEVTPVTIADLSTALCDWCGELNDAALVSDYLYAELLRMYDVTMRYDSLTEIIQKNTKLLSF